MILIVKITTKDNNYIKSFSNKLKVNDKLRHRNQGLVASRIQTVCEKTFYIIIYFLQNVNAVSKCYAKLLLRDAHAHLALP